MMLGVQWDGILAAPYLAGVTTVEVGWNNSVLYLDTTKEISWYFCGIFHFSLCLVRMCLFQSLKCSNAIWFAVHFRAFKEVVIVCAFKWTRGVTERYKV